MLGYYAYIYEKKQWLKWLLIYFWEMTGMFFMFIVAFPQQSSDILGLKARTPALIGILLFIIVTFAFGQYFIGGKDGNNNIH